MSISVVNFVQDSELLRYPAASLESPVLLPLAREYSMRRALAAAATATTTTATATTATAAATAAIVQDHRNAVVAARMHRWWESANEALVRVYGPHAAETIAHRLRTWLDSSIAARSEELFTLDLRREADPEWFQHPAMIGYVTYVDRFNGTISGVGGRLDYLQQLGVKYLHLMPLLKPRAGENDGGYAVQDYGAVDPRLGTRDDLQALTAALRQREISLCIDLVVNHTAMEHDWAVRARNGEQAYRDRYFFFPDRVEPDAYERSLREVFPAFKPGNFTWVEDAQSWVWTTFHDFQWDLDFSNPDVLLAMLEIMADLANLGVEVLRLDAIPFLWKRLGTDCENQPEVHDLLQVIRAMMAIAAPALLLKAEAIVPRDLLVPYVGAGDPQRHECDTAYNNQLMVMLWSSLATNDAELIRCTMQQMAEIPEHASWITYVRCHDDIGWAVTDDDAGRVGWDGFSHRKFLNDFYSGRFPDSFAKGALFQENELTGDARISGSAASLCGIEVALDNDDAQALSAACDRLKLVYAVAYAFGGIPVLYMGDELGLLNDYSFAQVAAHADDNRWMHRPVMNWTIADGAVAADNAGPDDGVGAPGDAGAGDAVAGDAVAGDAVAANLFRFFRDIAQARGQMPQLHGGARTLMRSLGQPELLCFERKHPQREPMWMIANFGRDECRVERSQLPHWRDLDLHCAHASSGVRFEADLVLPSLGWAWLVPTAEKYASPSDPTLVGIPLRR